MERDIRHGDSTLSEPEEPNGEASEVKEVRQDGERQTANRSNKDYTTVAIDIYGRVYDLSKEHPSWEQAEKRKKAGRKNTGFERCIVRDAFTCTREECAKLKVKNKKRKDNGV